MRKKLTLYIDESDSALLAWYYSIPRSRRNIMIRITLMRAIQAGLANPEELFPVAERQEEQKIPPRKTTTVSVSAKESPNSPPVQTMTVKPEEPKTVSPPTSNERESLIAFTLRNLPERCDERLREVATRFPKATPYTLEELETLAMLHDGLAD